MLMEICRVETVMCRSGDFLDWVQGPPGGHKGVEIFRKKEKKKEIKFKIINYYFTLKNKA